MVFKYRQLMGIYSGCHHLKVLESMVLLSNKNYNISTLLPSHNPNLKLSISIKTIKLLI